MLKHNEIQHSKTDEWLMKMQHQAQTVDIKKLLLTGIQLSQPYVFVYSPGPALLVLAASGLRAVHFIVCTNMVHGMVQSIY